MIEGIRKWFFGNPHDSRCCCFHFGRCGSTLLGNMLRDHPDVTWAGEVFHALHENEIDIRAIQDPFQMLLGPMRESNRRAFGFETKFQHLDSNGLDISFEEYLTQLQSLNFDRFIVLRRKNYLRQAVSVARGQLTKTWHVAPEIAKPVFKPFRLDPTKIGLGGTDRELVDCFQYLDGVYQKTAEIFTRLKIDCLDLCYEDDLEIDPIIGFQKVANFLKLSSTDPEVSLQKLEARVLTEIISNYDEIRNSLVETQYSWMCEA